MTLNGFIGIGIGLLIVIVLFTIWVFIDCVFNSFTTHDYKIAIPGFMISLIAIIFVMVFIL